MKAIPVKKFEKLYQAFIAERDVLDWEHPWPQDDKLAYRARIKWWVNKNKKFSYKWKKKFREFEVNIK
jgi:hypothetical protein